MKQGKKEAGITRRIRLYDCRHFYINYALASGADIAEVAKRVETPLKQYRGTTGIKPKKWPTKKL